MQNVHAQHTLPGIPEPLLRPGNDRRQPAGWRSTAFWLVEGLRVAFFRPLRLSGQTPAPLQVLGIAVLVGVAEVGLTRLQIAGPALFDVQAWLSTWWTLALAIGLAWWAFLPARAAAGSEPEAHLPRGDVAAFVALWLAASLPNLLLSQGLIAALTHGWIKAPIFSTPWSYWALYLLFTAWSLAVGFVLIVRFAGWSGRAVVFMLVLLAATGLTTWQFQSQPWQADYTRTADGADDKPRLHLTQQTMEAQQALWQRTVAAIAPERPGVTDVYGLVFAPYAGEDVFLRESSLVSRVLAERFDAQGRVIHLLNHGSSAATHPWATTLNLQRAIEVLAQRMDRDNDVLVVYLTSHGASDFRLSASHWPLEVAPLSPVELRQALDQAGIRYSVIAVSACYSGGWIKALANDNTLVMTAADATHTSYGCGRLSELTFFGRAMFDEQLRKTHSFEQAFAAAAPLIRQREIDAGKDDGFSNPQISVGANIGPVLRTLEQRLEALPPAVAAVQTRP